MIQLELEFISNVFNDIRSEVLGQSFSATQASKPVHSNVLWPSCTVLRTPWFQYTEANVHLPCHREEGLIVQARYIHQFQCTQANIHLPCNRDGGLRGLIVQARYIHQFQCTQASVLLPCHRDGGLIVQSRYMNISSCTQKQHTPSMHGSLYCLYFHVIEMEVSYIFLIFMRFFGKVEEFVLYYTVKNIIHFCPEHKVYAVTICANKYNTFILYE